MFNVPVYSNFTVSIEVGMDKEGEIDYLTKLIKPNLGLIKIYLMHFLKILKNLNQIAKS